MSDEERLARRVADAGQVAVTFEANVRTDTGGFSCDGVLEAFVAFSGIVLRTRGPAPTPTPSGRRRHERRGQFFSPGQHLLQAMTRLGAPAILKGPAGTSLVVSAGMADCSPKIILFRAGRHGLALLLVRGEGLELKDSGGEDGMLEAARRFAFVGRDGVVHGRKCDGPDGWGRLPGSTWLHVAVAR